MMKAIRITLAILVGYCALSSLVHYVVIPEPGPDPSDLPRKGTTILNEGIRSKFVYRQTSIETAGRRFEWDNYVDPGGGPIDTPHVHTHMREVFQVVDGEMRFVIDGRDRIVKAGETLVAEPGSTHAFQNPTDAQVHMISRFEPAEPGPWDELAHKGLLPDSQFVQIARAGGLGRVSPLQLIVFGSRFKQGYRPGIPTWIQDLTSFLVAPTARLFGYRAYYPPPLAVRR